MCLPDVLDWVQRNFSKDEVEGCRVLEIGSYDVNGSIRTALSSFHPGVYVGTDMRAGPGVDIVCRAEELVERFGEQSFDLVVSSCTFEHILRWKTAVSNMKHVCAPGGLLGFIVPDQSPYHAYPNDYWRYQEDDIVAIFADCKLLQLDHLPGLYSVLCAKLRKPRAFIEHDLNDYRLHSVVTGRRVATLRKIDFFSVSFAHVIWRDVLKPGIIKLIFALRQHRGLEN